MVKEKKQPRLLSDGDEGCGVLYCEEEEKMEGSVSICEEWLWKVSEES